MKEVESRVPTRERILLEAERLFAVHGVDGVTLRQIARAAEQRNVAAVQYHFGGKENLLRAILELHQGEIDAQRRAMLDRQEVEGKAIQLAALVEVLLTPLVRKLDDSRGRAYLQIQSGRLVHDPLGPATRIMVTRFARLLGPGPPEGERDRFAFILLFGALADRARLEARGEAVTSRDSFVRALELAVVNVLQGGSERADSAPSDPIPSDPTPSDPTGSDPAASENLD